MREERVTNPAASAAVEPRETQAPATTPRRGIGLCLSGRGFRATLFHLGALRRLNELGLLPRLRTVASVSGGSIAAAQLATALARLTPPPSGPIPDWDGLVARPLRAFTARDRRTLPILSRLLPWNWFRPSNGVEALAKVYRAHLTDLYLGKLPESPNFALCATDMAFGVDWTFERTRMGDWRAGYAVTPHDWPLARSVAASSCFPPIFNPLPVGLPPNAYAGGAYQGPDREKLLRDLRLSDGGVYDNLGLEPIWKSHAVVLVSDGGAPFGASADQGLLWRVQRYAAIQGNQAHALRVRWLIADFQADEFGGTYWGVTSATRSYDPAATIGYSKQLATEVIARIRTDLDAFSDAEACVLENHGYTLAEAALRRHVPTLVRAGAPSAMVPHPEWLDEVRVRSALMGSGRRRLFR
jgi:NTE family protein